ncbi:hypothetical protein HA402_009438 [Bradysia odoriphaga]|nr:hypothetical protein HA402_009438 [Bradysia odoriphaga]
MEQALTSRIGAFQLVEALLGSVPKERLYEKTVPISLAFVGTGKPPIELIVELTKKAHSTRSDIFVTDDAAAKELFRKYQCASFNALSAILCNTQTRLEFYDRLLFRENPVKSNFVWRNIIDQSNDLYSSAFTQEYDDFPKIKQRILSIRPGSQQSPAGTDAEVAALETAPSTLVVKLERSLITNHESMAVLCAVYTHLFDQKITPISENPLEPLRKTPEWVDGIAELVGSSQVHKNIRLFLVKSVEICRHIFRHYAHILTRSVLQLLVDECAGNQMSSFVVDLIVMLLEWKSDYEISSFEEIGLVSSLLEFLMKNAWNARKDVFKQNLEIIKNVIENWRDVISLKNQFLFDSINRTAQNDSRDNICGLQINAIVLANNLKPWTDTSQDEYFQSLVRCLHSEFTAVSQPAAQIIGMSLAIIQPDADNPCLPELNKLLRNLMESQKVKEFIDLTNMVPGDIATFMDEICDFVDSSVVECRNIMYEMLMFICRTFPDSELFQRSSSILLNGLIDPSSEIQTRIFNFWSDPARLPNTLDKRFVYLFDRLFDEQSEKLFLSYCTQLLLEPAILHPDSKRQMFEHQSDNEAELSEYDIDVSWKTQNSLIKAPLFLETNQTPEFSDDLISTQHIIRQTNTNFAFEPTRDPTSMSQTSDTFSYQSASSFLFSQQPMTLDRRSIRVNAAAQSSVFIVVYEKEAISEKLQRVLSNLKRKQSDNTELARYSPYLAKFHWCGDDNHLELPGQYTGNSCPIVSEHIKIVKFDEKVAIFNSMRMPIKIKIYGSNGKTYPYLVKYGDDMRQDERIQQIFHHMSGLLRADEKYRSHQLSIQGYQVVPISTCCGILSFVEHTMPMIDLIKHSLERKEGNANRIGQCREEFYKFVRVHSIDKKNQDNIHLWGRSVMKYSRSQIINNFRDLEYKIPDDIIKFALIELSVSPESFFLLRTNFITTLAKMNIAHWVLGIGDRHLSNILIHQKDAVMLGIDFNYAFGTGTRDAPIPELIPFRLSPHFVNVMTPFGTSGLITKTMIHTLRTFRSSRKLLTSYMESFVKEPTIYWLFSARSRNPDESLSSSDSDWEPLVRVKIAEQKLAGANPKDLFAEDLKVGQVARYTAYMNGYLNLLKGVGQANIRARLPEAGLTVEQQVQCLIDMATDPALLGITFSGFNPWI